MGVPLFICLCLFIFCGVKSASYRVATFEAAPFVVSRNGTLQGYSVDLWDDVATIANLEYEWIIYPGIADCLEAVENRTVDIAICDISITEARAEVLDFSLPILDSGLQIMIYASDTTVVEQANKILSSLVSKLFWVILGIFFLVIIVFANIFFAVESKHKKGTPSVRADYPKGFEDSLWWASSILFTGGGQLMPATAWGRLLTFLAIIISVILISILQATITAQLTVSSLTRVAGIDNVNDLIGKRVGVVRGSTGELFLSDLGGVDLISFENANLLLEAFAEHKDDLHAVFIDAPIVEYFINTESGSVGHLTGRMYDPQEYGIAFPLDSPVRTAVNIALLRLQETGTFFDLRDRYFSSDNSMAPDSQILNPSSLSLVIIWGLVGLCFLFVCIVLVVRYHRKRRRKPRAPVVVELKTIETEVEEMLALLSDVSTRLHRFRQNHPNMAQPNSTGPNAQSTSPNSRSSNISSPYISPTFRQPHEDIMPASP